MRHKWMIGVAGMCLLVFPARAAERSYNPLKWIKKDPGPTANQELTANTDEAKKLAGQLQALLPPRSSLKNACDGFKSLEGCVASLHVSHNLKIKFNCLKWDVNNAKPTGDVKTCSAPESGKAMSLSKAIRSLQPDVNARVEAKNAAKRAREDIKDASL